MGLENRFNIFNHLTVYTILGQNSGYIGAGVTAADQTIFGTLTDQQKSQCLRMQGEGSAYFYAADNTNAREMAMGISATTGKGFIGTLSAQDFEIRTSNVQRMLFGATGGATITNGDASKIGLLIKGASGQSEADLVIRNTSDTNLFYVTNGGELYTLSNISTYGALQHKDSANNSKIQPKSTGTVISRNVADTNSALIVNQANAASTGKIIDAQFAENTKGYISIYGNLGILTVDAIAGSLYGRYILGSSNVAPSISRNSNDAYSTIIFNNKNASATGDLSTWQKQSVNKASIDYSGVMWAQGYKSQDGSVGVASATFTTSDGKTVTVKNGLITAVV